MISDWELWACAAAVLKQHGAAALDNVEKRMTELAQAGDEKGVKTWIAIAERVDQLADCKGAGRARH